MKHDDQPSAHAARAFADTVAQAEQLRLYGRWTDGLLIMQQIAPALAQLDLAEQATHALVTARILTEQAGFGGFDTLDERMALLDAALRLAEQTADPALLGAVWDARGMSLHQAFLDAGRPAEPPEERPSFERGLQYFQQAQDQRGSALASFHLGLVYGVVRRDHAQALPYFQQSYALAQAVQDHITASYAIRHIGFALHDAGEVVAARASLHESLVLREQAGFVPGVAMALVMLAYADTELGQRDAAVQHLLRAQAIFRQLGAERKVDWVAGLLG
jgi:tetratricopeptide (TPR) repeat protein